MSSYLSIYLPILLWLSFYIYFKCGMIIIIYIFLLSSLSQHFFLSSFLLPILSTIISKHISTSAVTYHPELFLHAHSFLFLPYISVVHLQYESQVLGHQPTGPEPALRSQWPTGPCQPASPHCPTTVLSPLETRSTPVHSQYCLNPALTTNDRTQLSAHLSSTRASCFKAPTGPHFCQGRVNSIHTHQLTRTTQQAWTHQPSTSAKDCTLNLTDQYPRYIKAQIHRRKSEFLLLCLFHHYCDGLTNIQQCTAVFAPWLRLFFPLLFFSFLR